MQYRKMGKRGPEVSILGFGAMRLPYIGNDESKIDENEATRVMRYAIDNGVNYVDTAWGYHYGNCEPWMGRALKDGYREKVFLATKLPPWFVETREDCDKFLNQQLERLQTDYIDFYLLHALKQELWDKLKNVRVIEFLESALKDGRIRFAGFSFHGALSDFKNIVPDYDWTFCQIQYNFMDIHEQAGIEGLKFADERGLGVIIMEPLRGGNLAKQPPLSIQKLWDSSPVEHTPVDWALRWVWNHPEVTMLLSGMNSIEQVKENIAIASEVQVKSLTNDEINLIEKVRQAFLERTAVACTRCGYCMPCPAGVNIPATLRLYNEARMYENPTLASRVYYLMLKPEQQAPSCTECGQCEEKCPQNIPIREELKKAHAVLERKTGQEPDKKT